MILIEKVPGGPGVPGVNPGESVADGRVSVYEIQVINYIPATWGFAGFATPRNPRTPRGVMDRASAALPPIPLIEDARPEFNAPSPIGRARRSSTLPSSLTEGRSGSILRPDATNKDSQGRKVWIVLPLISGTENYDVARNDLSVQQGFAA